VARGKFLERDGEKLYVRGVTYGTFHPDELGCDYPSPEEVDRDFGLMAESGLNCLRTYTVPPRWLLDAAHRHGLLVMVGLPWEQHVAFLDEPDRADAIVERVREGVERCADHPAVLCYAVGNEIPASIVRWHGKRSVERFIERLYRAAKAEDPDALVTYVNFPSTEYLDLPFLDIACFNVYLESQGQLEAYLARLHNLAGERPLLMAEIGLDSMRNGEEEQARVLRWQIHTAAAAGCAGAFIFAWTDEWHRGGFDIDDWDFGLTRRDRTPKPALGAVAQAFSEVPVTPALDWPRISVVVCSYNGTATLGETLAGLGELDYPDFEVIVVDDGSTDGTAALAAGLGFRVISTKNHGLSAARNRGLEAADGEIVAYVDDDARPDPHWLTYLAHTFRTTSHAGVGGPNIAPGGDGPIADCVAHAPGGPIHVLLSDSEAEHIPGCNSAFRRECLEAIGGYDAQFRVAGDDVDVCWRIQQQGWTLGFNPAAVVWHHRRNSLRAYWRQQKGYGKAEALLERKWPEKYNSAGHLHWGGRMYGKGVTRALPFKRWRVYYGTWGSNLFQSIYEPADGTVASLPLMPEWYLVLAGLAGASALGALWAPLLAALPLFVLGLAAMVVQAARGGAAASFQGGRRLGLRTLTAGLHLAQPLARLWGRLGFGLTPWRRRTHARFAPPLPRTLTRWSEHWRSTEDWLGSVEARLLEEAAPMRRGGDFDRWEVEVRGGLLARVRLRMAVEEHGGGKQLARFRTWATPSPMAAALTGVFVVLTAAAGLAGAGAAALALAAVGGAVAGRTLFECSLALGTAREAVVATPDGAEIELPQLVEAEASA
jgi:O-antigen biosynthesis protein